MKIILPFSFLLFLALAFNPRLFAQNSPIQKDVPSLKEVYANDFTIGCLLSYPHIGFSTDPYVAGQGSIVAPQGGNLINYHMNCMTPGNNMKAIYTIDISSSAKAFQHATSNEDRDSVEIHPAVRFNGNLIAQLNWAKRQGFAFRGHTLVWHSQSPAEFFRSGYTANGARLSKELMTLRMENYIKEVIRIIHEGWPGMVTAIDVVNEAISDNNGAFRTSNNEWYTTFGDNSYVLKSFEFARKYTQLFGEEQIKLYYNDYNTSSSSKADGIVKLCKPIYEAGLLDGIGMQEHDSNTNPTASAWIKSYNKFDAVCNEMAITEIDVSTQSGTNTPSSSILETQANQYAMLFKCFVERSYLSGRGKIINVSKDGLNDQYTFVTNESSSLWDTNNQCKPSFFAVADVGLSYNILDSMINMAENLSSDNYSADKWNTLTSALNSARGALSKNYSASNSAVKGLEDAIISLENALNNLTGVDQDKEQITINITNGSILAYNLEKGSRVSIYRLNGQLINSFNAETADVSIPCEEPSIFCIIGKKNVFIKKVFCQ